MPPVKDPATGKFVSADPGDKAAAVKLETGKEKTAIPTPALDELSRRYLGGDAPKAEEKKKVDDKKAEEVIPKKPAAKPAAKPNPTTDALERTTKALETIVDRLPAAKTEDKKVEKETDPLEGLDASERRKVNVLRQMEKDFPENTEYKGLADRYLTGQKKLVEYAEKWQADHPGQDFDESAEEHQTFYAQHNVDWNDDDYIESITNIKAKSIIEAREAETNKKLTKLELAEKRREEEPNIAKEGIGAARNFWKQFGDEFAEVLSETGAVDAVKGEELAKADPDRWNIGVQAAQKVETLTTGMYKLINGLEAYNPEDKVHAHLAGFAVEKEKQILAAPPEDRKDAQGREFATRQKFRAMSEEERKKYWTFTATDLGLLIASDEAARAKKFIEDSDKEFRRQAALRGIKLDDAPGATEKQVADKAHVPGNEDDDDDAQKGREDNGKPRGPSATSLPKVAALAQKGAKPETSAVETFLAKQLAKS